MRNVVVMDIDGVCADFTYGFTKRAHDIGVLKQNPWHNDHQQTWDFDFHVDPVWKDIDERGGFWSGLQPLLGVYDQHNLREAVRRGTQFVYITARTNDGVGGDAGVETVEWLAKHGFPSGPVFLTSNKLSIVEPMRHQVLGIIDDQPSQIEQYRDAGLPIMARLALYNRHVEGVPFVNGVGEFVAGLLSER